MNRIGIIGGSGLDNPDILDHPRDSTVNTAWGSPSAALKSGQIAGVDVVLLARHGRAHTLPPSQVNYRANIQALKDAGCTHILATTAVGSLREEIGRGDLVIIDQFIDFTKQRAMSFHQSFAPHQPMHTPMAEPFDAALRAYRPKELPDPTRDLVSGRMGIREPGPGCAWFDPAALDFLIVPGLAYDPKGGRLGRGRGHYDRLLPHSRGVTCGVGFDEQIVPQVPVESHDVKLNAVLTPTRAWGAGTR
mgnify:CR=1 FL=1